MQIKTILNRIQKQRGFVYGDVRLEDQLDGLALTVDLYPHARSRPQCAGCGQRRPHYDRLAPRRFEFVPLWGLRVFFLYMMRRLDCPRCGVTVEQVPWADGKYQLTTTYMWFSRPLGQAAQLARGRAGLSHQLGSGVSLGGPGRRVGPPSRGSHGDSGD